MSSNYPPGVTGARYGVGTYTATCPTCGTVNVAVGYCELGGLFLEKDVVTCAHEIVQDQVWSLQNDLTMCSMCEGLARLDGTITHIVDGEEWPTFRFICAEGHETVTD